MVAPVISTDPTVIAPTSRDAQFIALVGGGYAIIYEDWSPAGNLVDVVVKFYDAEGNLLTTNVVQEDVPDGSYVVGVSGAATPDGGLIMVWANPANFFVASTMYATLFDATGTQVGADVEIASVDGANDIFYYDWSVTATADGGFAVVWDGEDGSGTYSKMRLFDADGVPLGAEFVIGESGDEVPIITSRYDGTLLIAYGAADTAGGGYRLELRDSTGVLLTPNVDVVAPQHTNIIVGDVKELHGGGVVVVWTDHTPGAPSQTDVYFQIYDSALTPVGGPVLVNAGIIRAGNAFSNVVVLEDGDFFIVWERAIAPAPDPNGLNQLWGQRFNPDGTADSDAFVIAGDGTKSIDVQALTLMADGRIGIAFTSSTTTTQEASQIFLDPNGGLLAEDLVLDTGRDGHLIALDGGQYAIIYEDYSPPGNLTNLVVNFYNANSDLVASNTIHASIPDGSYVVGRSGAALPNGDLIVITASPSQFFVPATIYATRFDSLGNQVGDTIVVAEVEGAPSGDTFYFDWYVTATTDGGFAVAWDGYYDDNEISQMRIFDADGEPVTSAFTIGDLNDNPPVVKQLANGNFIIGLSDLPTGAYKLELRDSTGALLDADLDTVAPPVNGFNLIGDIQELSGGGFLVAFGDGGAGNPAPTDYYIQLYDAAYERVGSAILVDAGTASGFAFVNAVVLDDGDIFVVYERTLDPVTAVRDALFGQRLNADGSPDGDRILIATDDTFRINAPTVSVLADGRVGVAYSTLNNNTYVSLYQAIYDPRTEAISLTDALGIDNSWMGTSFNDTLAAGEGDDEMSGADGDDVLSGGGGDDYLLGAAGRDEIDGGAGNDVIEVASTALVANESYDGGDDTDRIIAYFDSGTFVDFATSSGTTVTNIEELEFDSADNTSPFLVVRFTAEQADALTLTLYESDSSHIDVVALVATSAADVDISDWSFGFWGPEDAVSFFGSVDADSYFGTIGLDVMTGNDGADTLNGNDGDDVFIASVAISGESYIGGAGSDTLIVERGTLIVDPGEVFDGFYLSDYSAGTLTGLERITFGNPTGLLPNQLNSSKVAVFTGEQISGFSSLEIVGVTGRSDIVQIEASGGALNLSAVTFVNWNPMAGGELETGEDIIYVRGSDDADNVTGSSQADVIFAGEGDDIIAGGAGDDLIGGGAGTDQLSGGAGNDGLDVVASEFVAGEVLDGGADVDTLFIEFDTGQQLDLSTSTIQNIERIEYDSGGQVVPYLSVAVNGAQASAFVSNFALGGSESTINDLFFILAASATTLDMSNWQLSDWSGADHVSFVGSSGVDNVIGTGGFDALYGAGGADVLSAGAGTDLIIASNAIAGETYNGGADFDSLIVERSGTTVASGPFSGFYLSDFTAGTLQSLERFIFSNPTGLLPNQSSAKVAVISKSQVATGLVSVNLNLSGMSSFSDVLQINATGGAFSIAGFSFAGWTEMVGGSFEAGEDVVYVVGAVGADQITGSTVGDMLFGAAGDDTLTGAGGDDILQGGVNNDVLIGGAGGDSLEGGDGIDTASYAGAGSAVVANLSNQNLNTGDAEDDLFSSIENLFGTAFGDTLTGDTQANRIDGGAGVDTISGGGAGDVLDGGAGADQVFGDGGDDAIQIHQSEFAVGELVSGGSGVDTLALFGSINFTPGSVASIERVSFNRESPTVSSLTNVFSATQIGSGLSTSLTVVGYSGTSDRLDIVAAVGTTLSLAGFSFGNWNPAEGDLVRLVGSSTADVFTGTSSADLLLGNGGSDTLSGGAGADQLDGGTGADAMLGGTGDDTYFVDDVGDTIGEASAAGAGTDTVRSIITWSLGSNLENLVLLGAAAINAGGNALNNTITGNSAANLINGAAGADAMTGGAGDDTYYVDNAGDTTLEASATGSGHDVVRAGLTWTLANNVEDLILTGTGNFNATGNGLNNAITGNAGANMLNGAAGADTMLGGAGDDIYIVDNVGDITAESSGAGTDAVHSSVSRSLQPNLENLVLTGSGNINASGNTLNNTISGNSGNNVLNGALGNDLLTGGAGADSFVFSTIPNATSNRDRIVDFNVADDTIRLDDAVFASLGGTGVLAAGAFNIGAAATQADDRIVYNPINGALYYDADGSGSGVAVHFAWMPTNLTLTNADFLVI